MFDVSKISELIIAIKSAGLFKRVFKWKTILKTADIANDGLEELKNENLEYARREASLSDKIRALETEKEKLIQDLLLSRERLSTAVENSKNLTEKYEITQTELEKTNAEHKQTTEKLIETNTEKEKLIVQRDAFEEKARELESTNQTLAQDLAESREQLFAAVENSKNLSEKYEVSQTELEKITEEHKQTTEKLIETNTEKEKLTIQRDALEEKARELDSTNQTLAKDLAESRDRLLTVVENSKNLTEKYEVSQNELEKTSAEYKQTSEKLIEANLEKEKLKIQRDAFEEKARELDSTNQTLAKDLAESREQLSAAAENSKNLTEKYELSQTELEKITEEHKQINEEFLKITGERKLESAGFEELKNEYNTLANELGEAKKQIAAEESVRDERAKTYERNVENLNVLIEQLENDRRLVAEKLENEFKEHQLMLEESWKTHESDVGETIKNICKKYDFVFCEKNEYPHKGIPDNAVLIGGLYTIFDAKSPKNPEELDNFPQYLKQQAEMMSKYCKFDDVRKEVFLVVPQSTVAVLTNYCYPLAEYNVYIISPESILPIMQILKLIESYEFAEKLSPEDKDKLCRFIGKLSHTTKRKVQIDTYFAKELISTLHETDALPEEFADAIYGYEQKAKLNPPMEKRAKVIYVSDIESEVNRVEKDTMGWSVIN